MKLKGNWKSRKVWLDGKELLPRESQKVYNHSPDGFNWGCGSSGPSQLALAILLKIFPGDEGEEVALDRYQDFKWNIIAKLPQSNFEIELPKTSVGLFGNVVREEE